MGKYPSRFLPLRVLAERSHSSSVMFTVAGPESALVKTFISARIYRAREKHEAEMRTMPGSAEGPAGGGGVSEKKK